MLIDDYGMIFHYVSCKLYHFTQIYRQLFILLIAQLEEKETRNEDKAVYFRLEKDTHLLIHVQSTTKGDCISQKVAITKKGIIMKAITYRINL